MKNKTPIAESPPLGMRERKKADLKRRIADTAIELIRERGYENTTIDEIVRRVDVSQPTFYNYYPNKDAILSEYATTVFAPLFNKEIARSGTVATRMRRYLRSMAERMSEDRDVWYAIAVSNAYNPIRDPELLTASDATTRAIESIVEEGQKAGEFTTAYSAPRLASVLEGIMFRICLEWGARFPGDHSLVQAVNEGFDLFMRAATPRPGDKRVARPRRSKS